MAPKLQIAKLAIAKNVSHSLTLNFIFKCTEECETFFSFTTLLSSLILKLL